MIPAPARFFSLRGLIPTGLFLAAFMAVGLTASDYGVTWDEPPYFRAADLHVQWLLNFGKDLLQGAAGKSLQDENIKAAWHWDPYHVPHPPFSRIVSGVTKALAYPMMDKFTAYRLGPALFFALLVACMYLWMAELFGPATAVFSALTLMIIPNLFAFAHIAVTDMPLASLWFVTAYCFWRGLKSWKWSAVFGLVWGLALATKFPAVLIPIPLIFWAHLFYRRSYANNAFVMLFLSPVIMILCQPYLWHQPGLRILEFFFEGLSRAYRAETSFPVFFFGQLYYSDQLPWYYPFFVIAVTTPEPILGLALLGSVCLPWLRGQRASVALFLASAALILITGLLPGAVLHDGVRQLISVLPFVAALAGTGFFALFEWLKKWSEHLKLQRVEQLPVKIAAVMMILILFVPVLDLFFCHPFQLSYYNRLVGGILGAYRRGLEVTYFMEAFTPNLLRSLNDHLPTNATINASAANFMFEYYQKEGRLRPDIRITNKRTFDYYLLLNRQSLLSPGQRAFFHTIRPVISVGVSGVPLASVFRIEKPG